MAMTVGYADVATTDHYQHGIHYINLPLDCNSLLIFSMTEAKLCWLYCIHCVILRAKLKTLCSISTE